VPADEPFQSFPVGSLDADTGVAAKPTAVLPGEHVLGVVGLQEAVTAKVPQHPLSNRLL
jgi:hypothetical protein